MRMTVRKYTKEFKQESVSLALKSVSVSSTAKELGIPYATLSTWISTLKNKGNIANTNASGIKDMSELIEENQRLHKALAIAREGKEMTWSSV